jgi:ribosomal protein S18 acetylase RimI-like enzyme
MMNLKRTDLEIRPASKKELYTITVLTRKFFPYTGFNMDMISKRLKNKSIHYFVALFQGYTAGFIDFKENKESIKIMGLAVIPEMQRKGIGKKLIETAIDYAKGRKKEVIYLLVASENPAALNLYEKFGFKKKGKLGRQIWGMEVLLLQKKIKKEK